MEVGLIVIVTKLWYLLCFQRLVVEVFLKISIKHCRILASKKLHYDYKCWYLLKDIFLKQLRILAKFNTNNEHWNCVCCVNIVYTLRTSLHCVLFRTLVQK